METRWNHLAPVSTVEEETDRHAGGTLACPWQSEVERQRATRVEESNTVTYVDQGRHTPKKPMPSAVVLRR